MLLLNAEIAMRDCGDCQKHLWDHDKGTRIERGGLPILRPANNVTVCRMARGCAKGTPENPKTLSRKNAKAYRHYKRCVAVGRFPEDSIVERNAAVIRHIEDVIDRERQVDVLGLLRGFRGNVK